jgi:hypothetical protein
VTAKYRASGTLVWLRRWDSRGARPDDAGQDISLDAAGNVYVTATVRHGAYEKAVTMMYTARGVQTWLRSYGTAASPARTSSRVFDARANVDVAGTVRRGATGQDMLVIKYSRTGAQKWVRALNRGNRTNEVAALFSSAGSDLWVTSFDGGFGEDRAQAVAADIGGVVCLVGRSYRGPTEGMDALFLEHGANGDLVSFWTTGRSVDDCGTCMAVDGLGSVYWAGETQQGDGSVDIFVQRLSTDTAGLIWGGSCAGSGGRDDLATAV